MKLSIVTINYNNADGLRKTMESVFAQTCKEFEYIIIDGASIMPSKDDGTDVTGNSGNGRVKITYIGTSLN